MQYRSLGRSTVLGIKEQTNQTQNGTRCGPSLSIDTRRDGVMWHLHECGQRVRVWGYCAWRRVPKCQKRWEASEKASVTARRRRRAGGPVWRAGRRPGKQDVKDTGGELSGEIESKDTQPNNNAMPFEERDVKDNVSQVVSSVWFAQIATSYCQRKKCGKPARRIFKNIRTRRFFNVPLPLSHF